MTRPTRLLAALAVAVGLAVAPAGTALAAPGVPTAVAAPSVLPEHKVCQHGSIGGRFLCAFGHGIVGGILNTPTPVGVSVGTAAAGVGLLEHLVPGNIVETWAKDLAQAGAGYLGQVQTAVSADSAPDFSASWWVGPFAEAFGLSLVGVLLVLMYAMARAAKADLDGRELLRTVGIRAWWFVPAVAVTPWLLSWASGMTDDLSATLAGGAHADTVKALSDMSAVLSHLTVSHLLGGVITLLMFGLVTTVAGFLLLVELTVRSFGLYLAGALLPLWMAAAVNPRWTRGLHRVMGLVLGLLVAKPLVFLSFALMWGAAAHAADGSLGHELSTLLLVMVAAVVSCGSPALLAMAAPHLAEGLGSGHGLARRAAGGPARVASSAETMARRTSQWQSRIASGSAAGRASVGSSRATATASRYSLGAGAAAVPAMAGVAAASAVAGRVQRSATSTTTRTSRPSGTGAAGRAPAAPAAAGGPLGARATASPPPPGSPPVEGAGSGVVVSGSRLLRGAVVGGDGTASTTQGAPAPAVVPTGRTGYGKAVPRAPQQGSV